MVPLTRPLLGEPEYEAARTVLSTGMLVQGPKVEEFERAARVESRRAHAVAVSNGTAALELALRAMQVGPGDDVLCPALTWPSPAHAIRTMGARPVLVDVDLETWNVTKEACRRSMTGRVKAAIVIDQFGFPADADGVEDECGVPVLLDSACSLGSTVEGRPATSRGLISTVSFHPRKVITTGEGGMCLTDDEALAEKLRCYRNHGLNAEREFVEAAGNQRLTDYAAAIGVAQMARLPEILSGRRTRAAAYHAAFPELSWQKPIAGAHPNFQTMGATLPAAIATEKRDELIVMLKENGVQASILSFSLSRLESVNASEPCPIAEQIVDRGFAIPLFPQMTDEDQQTVIDALKSCLKRLA